MADSPPVDARMERSLRLLPYWWVLRYAWLGEAIWFVYLVQSRGLTVGQALLFDAVFFSSLLLSEMPTGVVADRYGRRISMLSGSLLLSAGSSSSRLPERCRSCSRRTCCSALAAR